MGVEMEDRRCRWGRSCGARVVVWGWEGAHMDDGTERRKLMGAGAEPGMCALPPALCPAPMLWVWFMRCALRPSG